MTNHRAAPETHLRPWRPPQRIRVKALGLLWSHGRLLCAEVAAEEGQIKGYRPPGGSVEFGERWGQALIREWQEEFGWQVRITGAPIILENIYEHFSEIGHEIVFAAPIETAAPLPRGPVDFAEDDGSPARAVWMDPANCPLPIWPGGLVEGLTGRSDHGF